MKEKTFFIVKTSSIGDLFHSLPVSDFLKSVFPGCKILWAVDERYREIIDRYPAIDETIALKINGLKKIRSFFSTLLSLRKTCQQVQADILIDLQGNTKSALINFFCKVPLKGGFGKKSVSEWPNLFTTNAKYELDQTLPIREQYLTLTAKVVQKQMPIQFYGSLFSLKNEEKQEVNALGDFSHLICLGSRWENKKLSSIQWLKIMQEIIQENATNTVGVIYGNEEEEKEARKLVEKFSHRSRALGGLSLFALQYLMSRSKQVLAVDSALMHLAGLTKVSVVGFFGPSSAKVYSPKNASAIQGKCPYNIEYKKRCPKLRTCTTAACIKNLEIQKEVHLPVRTKIDRRS